MFSSSVFSRHTASGVRTRVQTRIGTDSRLRLHLHRNFVTFSASTQRQRITANSTSFFTRSFSTPKNDNSKSGAASTATTSTTHTASTTTPTNANADANNTRSLTHFLRSTLRLRSRPSTDSEPERDSNQSSSFRKIILLAKPEQKPLLIAVGLLLVSSSVSLSVPFTIGKLIDFFASPTPQIPYGLSIYSASALLLTAFTIGASANAGRAILMRTSGQRIVASLRQTTYQSALRQEVECIEKGEGDILSRLSVDSSLVGESLTQNLSDGLRAVVMASVGLGAMFYLSPQLTLLMLTVVPPVSLGAFFYGRYLKKLSNRTQEAVGDMTKVASESLSAFRTVQAFNAQHQEGLKFQERVNRVLDLAKREALASGVFFGATGWSGNVTLLCLLGYGGSLVSKGVVSVGDLTSMLLYTVYVGNGLSMLTSFFASIMRAVGAGQRIFDLLERDPLIPWEGTPVPKTRRGPVKFENVSFEYPSRRGVEVLKGLDLELKVGESVAIVGQSGSGKSSVQSLLLRYYDPTHGRITFDGQDIKDFTPSSWRDLIGVVPQDPVLFTGTIASNIAYGYGYGSSSGPSGQGEEATRAQIEEAARLANCEFVWGMPKGFDTEIGRLSLSGGQRQRLAIARALLKKPAILAMDEATSSLDAASEHRVNDAIDKILSSRQTTCLIVAHRLSTIARAERIVVLEGGRITESGTYRQLVSHPESRFRVLMAAQLDKTTANILTSESSESSTAGVESRVSVEESVRDESENSVENGAESEGERVRARASMGEERKS